MRSSKILNLWNSYLDPLETINGVKFTPKEIELMACMLSGKSAKTISSFLSVSPKTIEGHLRNITKKLACNSRDGIIHFIENSDKLASLKEYYLNLLIQNTFKKALQEIDKLIRPRASKCRIIYWPELDDKNHDAEQLAHYLEIAGIKSFIEARKGYQFLSPNFNIQEFQKNHILYLTPEAIVNQLSGDSGSDQSTALTVVKACSQNGSKSIFFVSGEKTKNMLSQAFGNVKDISFLSRENIYFLIFETLEKLFPTLSLERIIIEFKQQYKKIQISQESKNSSNSLKIEEFEKYKNNFYKLRNFLKSHKWLVRSTIAFFCISCIGFSFSKRDQHEPTSIRSDLIVPTEAVFLDRPELIKQIDGSFKDKSRIQTIALIGPGGAGKTTLARQYAHNQKANIIWEINAETHENLRTSFENLANSLAKTKEDKKSINYIQSIKNFEERERKIIEFVKTHLQTSSDWFLIFDNVEKFTDIQNYFPQDAALWGQGKILITTRDGNIQSNNAINDIVLIGEMNFDQKYYLFMKIFNLKHDHSSRSDQVEKVKTFLESIPSFPLDISVAAYYLKATNIPYEVYVEDIIQNNKDFDDVQKNILKESGDYTKTRYGIIISSLQRLIKANKDFTDLLLFISLLDSQNIPRDLLVKCKDKTVVDNFIYNLKKYSLIAETSSTSFQNIPSLSIHRSTQSIILAYLTNVLNLNKNKNFTNRLGEILENYNIDLIDQENPSKIMFLSSHIESFLSHKNLLIEKIKWPLESELGCIYYHQANYMKAKNLIEKNINNSCNDYIKKARLLLYLGNVYRNLGNYEKAREILEQCYRVHTKYLAKNKVSFARALTQLGNIYRIMGDYEKSKDLLEQSLRIYSTLPSKNYIDIAQTLTHLGSLNRILGNFEKSIDLLEQSLGIYKKYISENHAGVPWTLIQLESVYRTLADYEKAKDLLEQALQIYNKYYPKNYNDISRALTHLGNIYRKLGNYKKAEYFLTKSLQIYKQHFPADHIEISWTLAHLGILNKELGNYEEAKNLLEKSLIVFRKHFPENHIEISWALAHLGNIHKELGNYAKAKDLLEQSLAIYAGIDIFKKSFSNSSLYVAWRLAQLGNIYKELGNYEAAQFLVEKSFKTFKKTLQKDNIRLSWMAANLANIYRYSGDFEKSQQILEENLEIYKKHYHKEHLKIAWMYLYIGDVYKELKNLKKAKQFLANGLSIFEKVCGKDKLIASRTLRSMGEVYLLENDFETAEIYFQQTLKVYQQNNHPDAYLVLENLADLYLKKSNINNNKMSSKEVEFIKIQVLNYFNQALNIAKAHFSEDSPNITRIETKLRKLKNEVV